jgi:hypothetical protein
MKTLLAHTYKNGKKVIKDVKKYYKSISKKAMTIMGILLKINEKNSGLF